MSFLRDLGSQPRKKATFTKGMLITFFLSLSLFFSFFTLSF